MRYRSTHTIDRTSPFLTANDVRSEFTTGAPADTKVSIQSSRHQFAITATFNAPTDDDARDIVTSFKRSANASGPADFLGLQVSTRKGWEDMDLLDF